MSENFSATDALKEFHTVDTVVWKQTPNLPVPLDKLYINSLQLLKRWIKIIHPGTKMTLKIKY